MGKRRGGYVAIVLNDESAAALREMAVHENVYCHHLTVFFKPPKASFEEDFGGLLGKSVTIQVTGIAEDAQGQAVACEVDERVTLSNRRSHVTISCADGVKPQYSNELLETVSPEPLELTLEGTVCFIPFG